MSLSGERNKPVAAGSVEPARDDRSTDRDMPAAEVMSGGRRGTSRGQLSPYGWLALLILATAVVNVLTAIQHDGGLARVVHLVLDEGSSAIVLIMLLPILRRGTDALTTIRDRRIGFIVAALAIVTFALLHVVLTMPLREIIYPLFGDRFDFHWREQFAAEFRKDIISAFMIVVVFWLIDRRSAVEGQATEQSANPGPVGEAEDRSIWLKDGTTSVRVDPADIISVTSAGNYVEFELCDQRYLVRGTLAAEETRLKPFGFCRVHRTRLVNTGRIAAIEQRSNGDFALRTSTGGTIVGSRRYRDALAAIKRQG